MVSAEQRLERLRTVIQQEMDSTAEIVRDRQNAEDRARREGNEDLASQFSNSRRYWRGRYDGLYKVAQAAGIR